MAETPELHISYHKGVNMAKNVQSPPQEMFFKEQCLSGEMHFMFPCFITRNSWEKAKNNAFNQGYQLRVDNAFQLERKRALLFPHSFTRSHGRQIFRFFLPLPLYLPLSVLAKSRTQLLLRKLQNSIRVPTLYSVQSFN